MRISHDCYLQSACVATGFLLMSPAVLLRGFSKFTQPCVCFSASHARTYSYAGRQLSVLDQLAFVFYA
jgi:hypothetical protein